MNQRQGISIAVVVIVISTIYGYWSTYPHRETLRRIEHLGGGILAWSTDVM